MASIDISNPGTSAAALKAALVAATATGPTTQTGTTYTYALTDANSYVRHSNANPITGTVPPHSSVPFPIMTQITVEWAGVGQLTLAPGVGVTINRPTTLKLNQQWAVATMTQVAINEWTIAGNMAAS